MPHIHTHSAYRHLHGLLSLVVTIYQHKSSKMYLLSKNTSVSKSVVAQPAPCVLQKEVEKTSNKGASLHSHHPLLDA